MGDETTAGDSSRRGTMLRRPFLSAVGACSGLGIASALGLSSVDSVRATQDDEETDWEAAADERIEEHRTADLEVRVVDRNGDPIDGADVDVTMTEHDYGFGTAVNAGTLIEESEPGDEYREHIPELFNKAVMENQHKWRFFEDDPDLADEATEWVLDQDLELRGHACLWASVDSAAVPEDVVSAMGREWDDGGVTDPEEDPEHVLERATEHIETIMEHYGDDITEWDVVNEAVNEPGFIRTIDDVTRGFEGPTLAEWYQLADDIGSEHGVGIDVNDYNVLVGPNTGTRQFYQDQIEFLLEEDVDLDGVGLQCHFSRGNTLEPDQVMDGLDLYADYDADIRITEFDTEGGSWDDEEKGEYLHMFLKTVFSHPATTDFVMWGFWDGRHWYDDAPLFYEDWEPKPGYEYYTNLVFDEWWTDEDGQTDSGVYETQAFHGEYELTASYEGEDASTTATITDDDTIELELDNEAGEDSIPGFGVSAALAGLAGLAGYAWLRDGDAETA
ncbi:endo-1,4-beta-xylanase [Natronolimnobius baerhuensis]|nr:endo-1,4-beta-xylanase [Natronolimnobius baerhuensis]